MRYLTRLNKWHISKSEEFKSNLFFVSLILIISLWIVSIVYVTQFERVKGQTQAYIVKYVTVVRACNEDHVFEVDNVYYNCQQAANFDEKKIRDGITNKVKEMKLIQPDENSLQKVSSIP